MCRTATSDAILGGQQIRKDDRIVLWFISANRDESIIENPNHFIIDREKSNRHLAFGAGIHHCVGEWLAAMQLRVLWEEILEENITIEVIGKPTRQYSNFVRGISNLPVCIQQ